MDSNANTTVKTEVKEEISELDRIFMEAGKETATVPSTNVNSAPTLDIPLNELTEEEQKQVDDIASKLDVKDAAAVMAFGAGTQQKMAEFSERTLESDRVGRIMGLLESWNCADGRWHRMGEACCGIQRMAGYKTDAGTIVRRKVADAIQLNAVKVRLKRTGAYLAKGYLIATTWDP